MAGMLAGCGGKTEKTDDAAATEGAAEEGGSEAKEDIEIGFSGDYLSDFMATVASGVETAAADNNVKVTIQDAEFDTAKQLQQVENFINAGMDAVVIKPVDSDACGPIKQACEEAGIPFVVVNSESNVGSDVFVGSDHRYSGQLQGVCRRKFAGGWSGGYPDGGNDSAGDDSENRRCQRGNGSKR